MADVSVKYSIGNNDKGHVRHSVKRPAAGLIALQVAFRLYFLHFK